MLQVARCAPNIRCGQRVARGAYLRGIYRRLEVTAPPGDGKRFALLPSPFQRRAFERPWRYRELRR